MMTQTHTCGLHALHIVAAARQLVADLARSGGLARLHLPPDVASDLAALVSATDGYLSWRHRAAARGLLPPEPTAEELAGALRAAQSLPLPEPPTGEVVTEPAATAFDFDKLFAADVE